MIFLENYDGKSHTIDGMLNYSVFFTLFLFWTKNHNVKFKLVDQVDII